MQEEKAEVMPTVPIEYSGKWIAWSADRMTIVSSGETIQEARNKAFQKGEKTPWLDKVPHRTIRFGGAAFRA
jgi:Family of unknown function (DUF5678)